MIPPDEDADFVAAMERVLEVYQRPEDPRCPVMEGKRIKKVEYGHRGNVKDVHGSEVLIFEFTDGTKFGLTAGSNASELKGRKVKPEDFLVDFIFNWDEE